MDRATPSRWCEQAIEGGWLLIALAVPLTFDAGSVYPFEPAKVAVLRTVAVVMAVAWLVESWSGVRSAECGGAEERGAESGEWKARSDGLRSALCASRSTLHAPRLLHPASHVRRTHVQCTHVQCTHVQCTWLGWLGWLGWPGCILHLVPALTLTLALLYLTATAFSIAPRISLWGSYQWREGTYTFLCLLALFALVARRLRTRLQLDRLVTAMLYASAVASGYGLLQFAGLDPIPWERPVGATERAFSTLGHPNFLGLYLAMTMPLAAARLLATHDWRSRCAYGGLLVVQAGCLLATFSRSAWLGMLAAGTVFTLLVAARARRAKWATVGLGTVALVLVGFAVLAYADPGGWASGGPLEPVHSLLRGKSATAAIRTLEWDATARLIAARPMLGTGPESFELAFQAVYPPALTVYGGAEATGGRAHNELLDWAVNAGLPGLAIYLALVVAVCVRAMRVARRAPRHEALVAMALTSGVVAYLVANQFSFGTAGTLSTLWLALGVLAALPALHSRSSAEGKEGEDSKEIVAPWKLLVSIGLAVVTLALAFGTNVVPLLADAHAKVGMYHLTSGDWSAAIAAYEQAIALQPDQDRYHALLASAHLAQAVNGEPASFPAAEAALDRAIALSPADETHWLAQGDVRQYWGEGHLDRAIEAYEEARRLSPTDPEPLVRIGQVRALQGRPADALPWLQAALVLDPLNVSAYTHLALAYDALSRPADAAEARRQALRAGEEIDRLISKR